MPPQDSDSGGGMSRKWLFWLCWWERVAQADHARNCFGRHPDNTPTDGDDIITGTAGTDVLVGGLAMTTCSTYVSGGPTSSY